MRNLKRALSLALASVMLLGMMVVGSSAKGIDDFTDAGEIVNQDAVAVTSAIGLFEGYEDGSFGPENVVTRAEMTVIICTMLYGAGVNVDQFAETSVFTDVPAWAEGYVNLCSSLGIVAGVGDGKFDPNATVTTAQAVLMLCRTLGYFQSAADFGDNWMLAATAKGTQLGLYGDLKLTAEAGLTRDNVAELVFNALTKAVPVQYNELLGVYYNENQGIIYSLEFNYLQTLGYKNFDLVYRTDTETIYGRPGTTWGTGSYNVPTNAGTTQKDDYLTEQGGLIADKVRMLDKNEIITVPNTPDYVYTANTNEEDVYDDLGATVCNDTKGDDKYTWTLFINGEEQDKDEDEIIPVENVDEKWAWTDKGAVTEVYIDDYTLDVTVVEINYYLGEVSKVEEDDGTITVRALSSGAKLDDRTFATTDFAEDDYVVFTVDYNDDEDFYICELMAPETVTGEVSRVQKEDKSEDTYLKMDDGSKYSYTNTETHMVYDVSDSSWDTHPELGEDYILYLTPAGYVLGFEPADAHVAQYLYVQDSDEQVRDWIARVDLPDGTSPKVDLDEDLDGTPSRVGDKIDWVDNQEDEIEATNIDLLIWDYSVNSSDVYSLDYVPELGKDGVTVYSDLYQNHIGDNEATIEINNGEAYIETEDSDTDFIVDKNTIFVDTMNNVAYTGYDEVPNVENAEIAYVIEDGVATIVFILDGDIYDEDSIYFMLDSKDRETLKYDGDKYWEYEDAYVDGRNDSQMVAYSAVTKLANKLGDKAEDYLAEGDAKHGDANNWILAPGVLYKAVKTVDDEYITELEVVGLEDNEVVAVGSGSFRINLGETVNKEKFNCDDETVFVLVEALYKKDDVTFDKWDISRGDVDDMFVGKDEDDFVSYVTVVENDKQYAELVYIVVKHEISKIKVTFSDSKDLDKTVYVEAGKDVEIPYEVPTGFEIDSISSGAEYKDGKIILKDVKVPADVVVTLKANGYAVTLSANSNATIIKPINPQVEAEKEIEVTIAPNTGYKITGVEGGYKWVIDGNNVKVTVPAGTKPVELIVNTMLADCEVKVDKASEDVAEIRLSSDKATIGTNLTVQVTAKTAGADGNDLAVYFGGVKMGQLMGGTDEIKDDYEYVDLITTVDEFNALQEAYGDTTQLYVKVGDAYEPATKDSFDDATTQAVYVQIVEHEDAKPAKVTVIKKITAEMINEDGTVLIEVK